ncbi:MAG: AraC family transcriptional regulator [Cyanobacteria bacterium]|nr:AraC family transcriptional regulator [Cyanobacteriota bacterium]
MSLLSIPTVWQASGANPGGLPLLTLPQTHICNDPVQFAEGLQTLLPVRSCDALHKKQPFRVISAGLRIGDLTVISNWGSGLCGRVEGMDDAQLIVPYQGVGHFDLSGRRLENRSGSTLLYLPGGDWQVSSNVLAGVVLRLPRNAIAKVRQGMAGPAAPRELPVLLESPKLVQYHQSQQAGLFPSLYGALALLNSTVVASGSLPASLRLDDLLLRLVGLLLGPLPNEPPPRPCAGGEPIEALIEWIGANCHRPLSLSDLESQSHYSRRSLQYAFRQRFGCGPMQYIRRQRLALAKQRLLAPLPGTTVTSVAQDCGYLSVASFRRDYQQRFGEPPSGALRRLRP